MMGYSHNGSDSSHGQSSGGRRYDTSQDRGYNTRDRDSSSRGYGNSRDQGLNSREFESREQRSNSRGHGASRDQGFNSRGYGEASACKGDIQGSSGNSWRRGSQGYGGEAQGFEPEGRSCKYSQNQSSDSRSYRENNQVQMPEPKSYGADAKEYRTSPQGFKEPRTNPSESKDYGGDAYNQHNEPVKYGIESGEYGSTPAEYDFSFEDKLFITCTQKFRPDDVCQFFKSFGALSAETDQEGEVVSTAKILFKTKEDAERVFAIWHSKFSLLFHCRMFFSRTSTPQLRESGPATTKVVVTGFASGIDELEVYHLFRSIGPLYDCSLIYCGQPANPPCAILQFIKDELNEQVISKFNGFQFQGEKLTVELFDKFKHFDSNNRSRTPLKANESYRVEVTGFPSDYDQAALLKYFKTVGEIIDVEFDGPNNKCMINYDTAIGAFGAMQRFNNYRVESRNLTVKSTGRPAPKPFASIPLIEKSQQASSVVPPSRDVKQSRWSQKADESSSRPRTSNYSGSNSGSQYGGEKPADQSSPFEFTSISHASFSNPQNQSSQPTEAPESTGWNAPASESKVDAWNAPVAESKANDSWEKPVVETNPNSWNAPVAEPKANDSWRAPAAEPKPSGWDAPVAEPKAANGWEASVVEPSSNSWNASKAEPKANTNWRAPATAPKPSGWDIPMAEPQAKNSWETSIVDSNPVSRNASVAEPKAKNSWDAPVVDSKIKNWIAPVAGPQAQNSWEAPIVESSSNSWNAPVAEPKANDSWRAPAAEAKPSGWDAPEAGPKVNHSWETPVVVSNPTSRNAIVAEPKDNDTWNEPVAGPKSPSQSGPYTSNYDQKLENPRSQGISKADSEQHSVSPSRSSTPEHMTLTQFLESNLSPPLVGLLKSLTPGSEHTIEQIIKTLFEKAPENMVALACTIQDVAIQVKEIEVELQEKHQFSISEEAYQRIKKAPEGDKIMCNYEFLPLHPQKEKLLQQIMMAPKEQSYPAMTSLLAKRLSHLGFSDTMPKAQAIAETSSLRLMMVSYCYDNVLQDLHDELVANQNRS